MHTPDTPRHARMFELLRQNRLAQTAADRLDVAASTPPDGLTSEAFQKIAVQSLKQPVSAQERVQSTLLRK